MPDLMERWFRELTQNAVPPGAFRYGRHPLQASKGATEVPEIFVTLLHDPLYTRVKGPVPERDRFLVRSL